MGLTFLKIDDVSLLSMMKHHTGFFHTLKRQLNALNIYL